MIKGSKVYLCEIDPDNIEWMRQQRNKPDMRKYFREWKDITKDQQQEWYQSRGNNSNPNHVYFEIHANGTSVALGNHIKPNQLVGVCGLHYIDWRLRSAEFGIFIDTDVHGLGLGKNALITLFDFGFREMNLHKIWAEVYEFNQAMHVYTDKLGMQVDGKLRHNTFCDGKYHDSIMLSILENEWFDKHGN